MHMHTLDIVVRNARLRRRLELVDIGIRDGRIAALDERVDGRGEVELDAAANLVTESFVNPHLHLDKVFTLERGGEHALAAYNGESHKAALPIVNNSRGRAM